MAMEKTICVNTSKKREIMKFKVFIFAVLMLFTNCFASKSHFQIEYEKIKGKTMYEDFDIKMYEKNKKDIDEYFSLGYGKNVRQISSKTEYLDYIQYDKPSVVEELKRYYPNKQIKTYILRFRNSGFFMTVIEFDKNKKITKNIDYDEKYAFKAHELFSLIETRFKEINLWAKETEIYRPRYYAKEYAYHIKKLERYDNLIVHVPMKIGEDLDVYFLRTVRKNNKNDKSIGTVIELIVNAQTGEVLLYGTYKE